MKTVETFGKLRERIRITFGTQKDFASAIGWHVSTLNLKLNGKVDWSRSDIFKVCDALCIPTNEVGDYFFYK